MPCGSFGVGGLKGQRAPLSCGQKLLAVPLLGQRISQCLKGLIYFTGIILTVMGIVMLLAAWEDWLLLRRRDGLFGVRIRAVLAIAGVLHLAVSGRLFATRDLMRQGLLLLWIGLNHAVYRIGQAWLKAAMPLPILRVIGMKVGIQAQTLDIYWKLFMVCLLVGSFLVLVFEWRRRKRLETEAFLVRWRKTREKGETLPAV